MDKSERFSFDFLSMKTTPDGSLGATITHPTYDRLPVFHPHLSAGVSWPFVGGGGGWGEREKLVGWFGSGGGGCSSQWSEGKAGTKGLGVCGSFHRCCCFCVNVGNVYADGRGWDGGVGGQQGQFGVGAGDG